MKTALKKLSLFYIIDETAVKGLKKHYGYFKILEDYYFNIVFRNQRKYKPKLSYHDYGKSYGFYFYVELDDELINLCFKDNGLFWVISKDKYLNIRFVAKE